MSPSEVLTGILSLVGAGGVTSIVVGFLAFKTEAVKGRRKPLESADLVGVNGTVAGSHDIELLANGLAQMAGQVGRLNVLLEFHLCPGDAEQEAFEAWLEKRDLEEALRLFRSGQKR